MNTVATCGVYAVRLKVHDEWHDGVCNIGYKPTFKENERQLSIEVHLFEFNKDIYDQSVTVEWHMRIREEKKFNGIDELVAQIAQDKKVAQEYFASVKNILAFSMKSSILCYVLYDNHYLALRLTDVC